MAVLGTEVTKEQEQTQVEGTTPKVDVPAPAGNGMNVQMPKEANAATRRFARGESNPTWFLDRDGELELVTDEDTNPALGIIKIYARAATDAQFNYGVIANVSMDTVIGRIDGLQIRETKERDGNIQLSEPSSSYMSGEKKMWNNYTRLAAPVRAQILSHVWKQLEPVE